MLPTPANSLSGTTPNYPTTAPSSLSLPSQFQAGSSTIFHPRPPPSGRSSDLLNDLADAASLSTPIYTQANAQPNITHLSITHPAPAYSSNPTMSAEKDEVVQALSKQIAYLEGDPGASPVLKVHYVRLCFATTLSVFFTDSGDPPQYSTVS